MYVSRRTSGVPHTYLNYNIWSQSEMRFWLLLVLRMLYQGSVLLDRDCWLSSGSISINGYHFSSILVDW